jgi:hypothetical protein
MSITDRFTGIENKIVIYDPNIEEQIICIELENNNKIYIKYEIEWTIKDVKNKKINSF